MRTIYVVDKKNEIVGEVILRTKPEIDATYFYFAIAHAFGVHKSQLKVVKDGTYDLVDLIKTPKI